MKEIHIKLGEVLKLERERRQLTLETVSDELKIGEENLGHVEAGDADATPSELYFTLFAKSYAQFLGIDYPATIEAIKEDIGLPIENGVPAKATDDDQAADQSDEASDETESGKGFNKKLLSWAALILVIFAGFLITWQVLFDDSGPFEKNESATEAGAIVEADKVIDSVGKALTEYQYGTVTHSADAPLILKMTASQESWAMIVADGDTVIRRNLVVWREYVATAKYRLQVSIAHPGYVQTTLNGQPVDLRDQETRRIRNREITQVNWEEYFEVPPRTEVSPPPPVPVITPVIPPASSAEPTATEITGPLQPGHDAADSSDSGGTL